jgi:ribosome-associated toxin RatA of RatAB toxin-antitoxin module
MRFGTAGRKDESFIAAVLIDTDRQFIDRRHHGPSRQLESGWKAAMQQTSVSVGVKHTTLLALQFE